MSPADASSFARQLTSGLTLIFGVVNVPYRNWMLNAKKTRRVSGSPRPITTGEVANILEAKYHVMQAFWKVRQRENVEALEQGMANAIQTLLTGRFVDPFGSATSAMETRFKHFISSGESERAGIIGVPTKAALRGVNHRLRHPYSSRNPRRPSFYDTHTYANSAKVWMG